IEAPMAKSSPAQSANRLLARLPPGEFQRLSPLLHPIALRPKQGLSKVGDALEFVYFPLSGIISAMAVMKDGRAIEVATIGNEGMSGLTALLGGKLSPYEVMVQIPEEALQMHADVFARETATDNALRKILTAYHAAFGM